MMYKSITHEKYKYKLLQSELDILEGYCWDGPSGPAIDTQNFMRGSLLHDCLYQLIRDGYIIPSYRKTADIFLFKICREDGMSWIRGVWVYLGVRMFGWRAIK